MNRHRHLRLDARAQSALLDDVVRRAALRTAGATGVVVFDLDGTVCDNRPRSARIFHELAEHWTHRAPEAARRLAELVPTDVLYRTRDTFARVGVHDVDLVAEAERFWAERFFVDAYIGYDVEVPGAARFARAIHDAGGTVVYLTGRDLPNMSVGSWASLRDLGFPIGLPATQLVLKPRFEIPDDVYKREVAPELRRIGHVVAVFDNEPANCNVLLEQYPGATSVLVDTQHAPDPPPLRDGVRVIADFET